MPDFEAIDDAIFDGDISKLQGMLNAGLDANTCTPSYGWNMLHMALVSVVDTTDLETLRFLVDSGVDVDAPDKRGYTPLHFAARRKDRPAVQLLVDNGADPNVLNDEGVTPLQAALSQKPFDIDVLRILLEGGADPDLGRGGSARKLIENIVCDDRDEILTLMEKYKPSQA